MEQATLVTNRKFVSVSMEHGMFARFRAEQSVLKEDADRVLWQRTAADPEQAARDELMGEALACVWLAKQRV